jgi:hypothetical protein
VLLQGAKLGQDIDDTTTYFIGTSEGGDTELGSDRLTFTTVAPPVPLAAQGSDADFETQHQEYGPVGGMAEVSWGTVSVGDAGDRTGLFERLQRPADGDPEQGGLESLLGANIDRIGFEFYDGTSWAAQWDTLTGGERRLPAAVRVNYVQANDPTETVHRFVVPIPTSDVDVQNPSLNGGVL